MVLVTGLQFANSSPRAYAEPVFAFQGWPWIKNSIQNECFTLAHFTFLAMAAENETYKISRSGLSQVQFAKTISVHHISALIYFSPSLRCLAIDLRYILKSWESYYELCSNHEKFLLDSSQVQAWQGCLLVGCPHPCDWRDSSPCGCLSFRRPATTRFVLQ
jgi:hypothetical protein